MPEYTEKQKADRQKAVRNYEKNNYRLNIVFPKGTKERIEKLGLDKTNSAFIRDTVLANTFHNQRPFLVFKSLSNLSKLGK